MKAQTNPNPVVPVITNVNVSQLARAATGRNVKLNPNWVDRNFGLNYYLGSGEWKSISVVIYPTAREAQQHFDEGTMRRATCVDTRPPGHQKIGDAYRAYVYTAAQCKQVGEAPPWRSGGTVFLRQNNVLLAFVGSGDVRGAAKFAKKLVQGLSDRQIAPVGVQVKKPSISITVPGTAQIRQTITVVYSVDDGSKVAILKDEKPSWKWNSSGQFPYTFFKTGKQSAKITLMTPQNVAFDVPFTSQCTP